MPANHGPRGLAPARRSGHRIRTKGRPSALRLDGAGKRAPGGLSAVCAGPRSPARECPRAKAGGACLRFDEAGSWHSGGLSAAGRRSATCARTSAPPRQLPVRRPASLRSQVGGAPPAFARGHSARARSRPSGPRRGAPPLGGPFGNMRAGRRGRAGDVSKSRDHRQSQTHNAARRPRRSPSSAHS